MKLKLANFLLMVTLLFSVMALASSCSKETTTTPPSSTAAKTTTVTTTSTTPPKPANPEVIMSSTTSTRDSTLMDTLIPIFEQKTGYKIKPVYVGTGAAITMGQQGNADVVLVHSPVLEKPFMDSGVGINRRLVMHNYYLIVGPPSDPAGIKGITVATDALQKIANAKATFYSRGDNSGTDTTDKSLFKQIGISVADNSTANPSWYKEGGTGTGMLDLLRIASEKNAYTLTDTATYVLNLTSKIFTLDIMVQGDPALINIYHVIQVNPDKFPNVNAASAKAFSDFMVDPATQDIIAKFGIDKYGKPVFIADAGKTEASLGSY
ncbi:MAG: substrate-binding domain-containing protein [Dehalococcoidales bacterium]